MERDTESALASVGRLQEIFQSAQFVADVSALHLAKLASFAEALRESPGSLDERLPRP